MTEMLWSIVVWTLGVYAAGFLLFFAFGCLLASGSGERHSFQEVMKLSLAWPWMLFEIVWFIARRPF